ncbi:hypothetical protein BX666DRAFT_1959697 [Dichotomocladium elegans]|nr:hypothetical protein BX666DRAFT_1959697 [Dichotomocladium elegans]
MRMLLPFVTIVVGLSMVSVASPVKSHNNRMARIRRGATGPINVYHPLSVQKQQHHHHHSQQQQEVHVDPTVIARRRLSVDSNNHRHLSLRKRAPPARTGNGSGGTVVGGLLGGANKPIVLDTSPDPTDVPQSKPNPNELFVGPVLEKKLLDVKTPGASGQTKGPAPPMVKLNTEHHKIVETTVPDVKQGPLGMGNQTPPPTP